MKKYPQVYDNEWIQPVKRGYRMACCDCGLVHDMDFRIHKGRVQLRARRNKRSTAAIRRHRHPSPTPPSSSKNAESAL